LVSSQRTVGISDMEILVLAQLYAQDITIPKRMILSSPLQLPYRIFSQHKLHIHNNALISRSAANSLLGMLQRIPFFFFLRREY
jgi:hypothetical protein